MSEPTSALPAPPVFGRPWHYYAEKAEELLVKAEPPILADHADLLYKLAGEYIELARIAHNAHIGAKA